MIVVLSPAKTLDLNKATVSAESSEPEAKADADYLVSELAKLDVAGLKTLLGVNPNLALLNHDRYQNWDTAETKQCVLSYDGPAFKNMRPAEFSQEEFAFAQDHVRILSGLYGALRPLDVIKPYRLEMSTKLATREGKNLYAYWTSKLTATLKRQLDAAPDDQQFLVNCASKEYAKAVDAESLGMPIYQMTFPGPGLFAKAARGAMVGFIVRNKILTPEGLKDFQGTGEEWSFDAEKSSEREFVFSRRPKPNAKQPQRRSEQAAPPAQKKRQRRSS